MPPIAFQGRDTRLPFIPAEADENTDMKAPKTRPAAEKDRPPRRWKHRLSQARRGDGRGLLAHRPRPEQPARSRTPHQSPTTAATMTIGQHPPHGRVAPNAVNPTIHHRRLQPAAERTADEASSAERGGATMRSTTRSSAPRTSPADCDQLPAHDPAPCCCRSAAPPNIVRGGCAGAAYWPRRSSKKMGATGPRELSASRTPRGPGRGGWHGDPARCPRPTRRRRAWGPRPRAPGEGRAPA